MAEVTFMEERTFRTICQFCHTNCGIIIHRGGDGMLSVEGDPDHPVNRGQFYIVLFLAPDYIRSFFLQNDL